MKLALHSAEMARIAGSSDSKGVGVYIIPWFFAKLCTKKDVLIVWPDDGVFTSPLYLLAKKEKIETLAPLINYVTGEGLGKKSARSCLPALNPLVDNNLPEEARFKRLGWDYLKSNDAAAQKDQAHEYFIAEWKKQQEWKRES